MGNMREGFFRSRCFSPGKLRDERGAVLLMTVLLMVVLLLMAGLAVDFTRAWVAGEQLQTAVDAASLAGARHAERYVTVTVWRGHEEWTDCCNEEDCWPCPYCVQDDVVDLTGQEKYLVDRWGWMNHWCDIFMGIRNRWLVFPPDTESVAAGIFDANWPDLLSEGGAERPQVHRDKNSDYYPSVVVRASGSVETTLLRQMGMDDLPVRRCGQAGAFYSVIKDGWELGKSAAPRDACR